MGTPAGTAGAALSSKAKPSPAAAGNKKRVSGEAKPTHAHKAKTKGKGASKSESKTSSMLAQPVTENSTAKPASNPYDEVMSRLDKLEHMFGKFMEARLPADPEPADSGNASEYDRYAQHE